MTEGEQYLGKERVNLSTQHRGPLMVVIRGLGSFTPNFKDGDSLFGYVGHSAAVLGTDFTRRLSVTTCPQDWLVHRYDPKEGILDVEQIDGEMITPLEEDHEGFERFMNNLFED